MFSLSRFLLFFCVIAVKLFIFYIFRVEFYTLSGDAIKYNEVGLGNIYFESSWWPIFLGLLSSFGIYNYWVVLIGSLFFSSICFFYMSLYLIGAKNYHSIVFYAVPLYVSFYPTLLYFSFDIFRDSVMLAFLFISIFIIFYIRSVFFKFIFILVLSAFLFMWRKYLGFAFLLSGFVFLVPEYFFLNLKRIFLIICFGFSFFVFLLDYPIAENLVEYNNNYLTGSLTLYELHDFDYDSLKILYSILVQVFGFYFNSYFSLFFLFESVFFIFCCAYIFYNWEFKDINVLFLLALSLIYTLIWSYASINFGTGLRLRIITYTLVFLAAGRVFVNKFSLNRSLAYGS